MAEPKELPPACLVSQPPQCSWPDVADDMPDNVALVMKILPSNPKRGTLPITSGYGSPRGKRNKQKRHQEEGRF